MKKQAGASILLMTIVLIILAGTPLLLKSLEGVGKKSALPAETILKLALIDDALAAYVSTNRRLPCGADGATPASTGGVGSEARDSGSGDCLASTRGVVPWVTLGLTEADATDAWGGRFTYRVKTGSDGLTRNGAVDATFCDPTGTRPALDPAVPSPSTAVACASTCLPPVFPALLDSTTCNSSVTFMKNRGYPVRNALNVAIRDPAAVLPSGAAYVVISHGPEGGGAYNGAGIITASDVPAGANGEVRNLNNNAEPAAGYFSDNAIRSGIDAGADHFDDVMSYPSIASLLARTGLGARSH